MESLPTIIQDLPQPLRTWLTPSLLTPPHNNASVLFVDPSSLDLLNTPYSLSKIYPAVKKIYPDVVSVHILSYSLSFFMKNNIIEFYSVEA